MRAPQRILIALLSISLISIPAIQTNAAVKDGAKCANPGQVKKSKSSIFICAKQGKKLTWRMQTSAAPIPNPSTSPTSQPSPSQTLTPQPPPSLKPSPSPSPSPTPSPSKSSNYKTQGEPCLRNSGDVIGYDLAGRFVTLMCNQWDDRYFPRPGAPDLDQTTLKPLKSRLGNVAQTLDYVAPKPISGEPITKISDGSALAPIDSCRIKDAGYYRAIPNNPQRHFISGFPNYPERANFKNKGVLQFVTVDFSDLPGQRSPKEDLQPIVDFMSDYFTRQASMPIELKFRIPDRYIRMPKSVAEYDLSVDFFSGKWTAENSWKYVRDAIRTTDPFIDFSGASMIAVAVPAEVTRKQIGAFIAQAGEPGQQFVTNEGDIYNLLVMAGPVSSKAGEYWNWAHELGHLFGLTDIRNTVDVSKQDSSDLGMLDLMNSAMAPELLAWNRFIMGILFDEQIRCVTTTTPTTHRIIPVAQPERLPKAVVIPTETYKGIVVESRRSHGYDTNLGSRNEGVFVYTVDTTIPYRYSTMKLVPSPTATDTQWRRDAALQVGESVTTNGWKITYIETGSFGDVVRVEKA